MRRPKNSASSLRRKVAHILDVYKRQEVHLTPIEYKLLCVLAHNVGKVLTHTSLTQKVWGSTQENDIASRCV